MADPRFSSCLPGVPHLITVAILDDDGSVQIVLPIGLFVRTEDDNRLAPANAILALDQGNAFLGPPGEPHSVGIALFENGDVEAGSKIATEDWILRVFHPASGRLGLAACGD